MNPGQWSWRYADADGGAVPDPVGAEPFASRGDAESWLGENWRSLAAAGVRSAQLMSSATAVGRLIALPERGNGSPAR